MTGERRRFTVTGPDWGQTHLSLDAIVAFVDDELTDGARRRATQHLSVCPECAAEVVAQGQARTELRAAAGPGIPSSLLSSLRSIPVEAELPGPPPGLAVGPDGGLVAMLRPEPAPRSAQSGPSPWSGLTRRWGSRRSRLGAGAAISGLALGALTLGGPLLPPAVTPADRGTPVGGPARNVAPVLDARLQLNSTAGRPVVPAAPPATSAPLPDAPADPPR
jgi:hypothetical protein